MKPCQGGLNVLAIKRYKVSPVQKKRHVRGIREFRLLVGVREVLATPQTGTAQQMDK
jgi:hypothetical protein